MSPTDEEGRHKRRFLMAHGFDDERPGMLVDALLAHAATAVEVSDATTVHGRKWVLRGRLRCPDGRQPVVQVVWMQNVGRTTVRLITAYPIHGEQR